VLCLKGRGRNGEDLKPGQEASESLFHTSNTRIQVITYPSSFHPSTNC
jgi:hypothetical protein